jgi:hypothetical protein
MWEVGCREVKGFYVCAKNCNSFPMACALQYFYRELLHTVSATVRVASVHQHDQQQAGGLGLPRSQRGPDCVY